MNTVIIFDISGDFAKLKTKLQGIGYWDRWTLSEKTYHLPSNTLWKPNIELAQAKKELEIAIQELNQISPADQIDLQRFIALPVNPWEGIPGTPLPLIN